MKKLLLTLLLSSAICAGAQAWEVEKAPFDLQTAPVASTRAKAPTADGFDIDFCGNLYS